MERVIPCARARMLATPPPTRTRTHTRANSRPSPMLRTRIHPQSKTSRAALSSPLKRCYHFLCVCVCVRARRVFMLYAQATSVQLPPPPKNSPIPIPFTGARCEIVSRPPACHVVVATRHCGAEKRWEIHFHVLGGNFKCVCVCVFVPFPRARGPSFTRSEKCAPLVAAP